MITEIGIAAGDIWHYLDESGKVKLSEIAMDINKERDLLLMSLGWLAREGHVKVDEVNGDYEVALTQPRVKE
ncbi:MAG: winged helix-turn-helix domain-containing protein [Candidatus Omnitrophota bacterium]